MNKNTLLNQLIDEIGNIEVMSFTQGVNYGRDNIKQFNAYDEIVARHKTNAFKIIENLKNLEIPKHIKGKNKEFCEGYNNAIDDFNNLTGK